MTGKIFGITLILVLICSTSILAAEESKWMKEFNEKMNIMQKKMELSDAERKIIEDQIKPLVVKWDKIHQDVLEKQKSVVIETAKKYKKELDDLRLKNYNKLKTEREKLEREISGLKSQNERLREENKKLKK